MRRRAALAAALLALAACSQQTDTVGPPRTIPVVLPTVTPPSTNPDGSPMTIPPVTEAPPLTASLPSQTAVASSGPDGTVSIGATNASGTTAVAGATPSGTIATAPNGSGPDGSTFGTATGTLPATAEPAPDDPPTYADDATLAERDVMQSFADRAYGRYGSSDGITVAIARNGIVVGSWAAGRDVTNRPIPHTARFRLASISKVITSIAVLRLVDAGKIDLDAPVVQYWKPAQIGDPAFSRITIRQLLSHTSGIQKLRNTFFEQRIDWHDTAQRAARADLTTAPGTKFDYSNANYTVLGMVIESVTGTGYADAVQDLVFDPMGVTTAKLMSTQEMPAGDVRYHVGTERAYMEALGPSGQWTMSADDLARVVGLITPSGQHLLSPEMEKARRTAEPFDTRNDDWRYGLGQMIFRSAWGHTGTIESSRNFALTTAHGYSVVVLASTQAVGSGEALIRAFLPQIALLAGLPAAPVAPGDTTPPVSGPFTPITVIPASDPTPATSP